MCTKPQRMYDKENDRFVEFACRTCDACLATRLNDWVARGVAEAAIAEETLAVRFSYRNFPDGTKPDGAVTFVYADIQKFFKKLREAYNDHYGKRGEIRYIVCGERGSKFDRVHYHVIIFSDQPISLLGEWKDHANKPIDKIEFETNIHWSLWDHGHLYFQQPGPGGIRYALKYAMDDQFSSVKSKGHAREAKSKVHSASLFRPSKKPPIGFRWLEWKLNDWEARFIVPTDLNLKPEGLKGYWYPKGKLREYLLRRIREININHRIRFGRNAPAWSALLSSVSSQTEEWEFLVYGPQLKHVEEFESLGSPQEIRERCGGVSPCQSCYELREFDWERGNVTRYREEIRSFYYERFQEWFTSPEDTDQDLEQWQRKKNRCNPFCQRQCSKEVKDAFA